MAGTNLYWGHGEGALQRLVRERRIPVFLNGLARGCVPADDELFFSRARGAALTNADVALVIGVPMDFRLGFGGSFGETTEIVTIDRAEPLRDHPRAVAAELYGGIGATLDALTDGTAGLETDDRLVGRAAPRRSRPRSSPPRRPSSPTTARRCIRCGSTTSSTACSTATRSSSATAATSSPTPGA